MLIRSKVSVSFMSLMEIYGYKVLKASSNVKRTLIRGILHDQLYHKITWTYSVNAFSKESSPLIHIVWHFRHALDSQKESFPACRINSMKLVHKKLWVATCRSHLPPLLLMFLPAAGRLLAATTCHTAVSGWQLHSWPPCNVLYLSSQSPVGEGDRNQCSKTAESAVC